MANAATASMSGGRAAVGWSIGLQVGSYTAASFAYQLFVLVQSVVVARLLGPALLGVWESLSLVTLYNVSHLGVINAVQRDIPIARGRADWVRVDRLRNHGFVMALGPSLMVGLGVLAYAAATWPNQAGEWRIGLLGLAGLVVVQQLHSYFQVLLRAENRFQLLSANQLVLCLAVTFHVALIWVFGFTGQVLGVLIVQALGLLSIVALAGYRPRFVFDAALLRHLLAVGLPLGLVLLSDALLLGVDRTLIVALFGTTELGYYRLAVIASGWLTFVPGVMSQMLYPRMGERFGATNDLRTLRNLFEVPSLVFAALVPLLWGGIYLLLPALVALALPAFSPGVGPARVATLGVVFLSLFGTASYVLMVGGRALEVVAGQLWGAATKAILIVAAYAVGLGLQGIAAAVAAGYLAYGAWLYWRGGRVLELGWRDKAGLALRLLSPLGAAAVLALALEAGAATIGPAWSLPVRGVLTATGFTLVYGALAVWWLRRTSSAAWDLLFRWVRRSV